MKFTEWPYKHLFMLAKENTVRLVVDLWGGFKEIVLDLFIYAPRRLCRFFRKLYDYAPVLWHDVDYDYSSLLRLMQYKISRLRKHIGEHNFITSAPKICKQMAECERLIQKLLDDDWTKEEDEAHDKKWGEIHTVTIPIPGKPLAEWRTVRLNVRTEVDKIQERKEFQAKMRLSIRREQAARTKLFKILAQNICTWWD